LSLVSRRSFKNSFSAEVVVFFNNGCYVMPWGRIHTTVAPHLLNAMRLKEIGGTGRAKAFYEFCEDKTKDYY